MPISTPTMPALRMAARYSGFSATSMVICVQNFMSPGISSARRRSRSSRLS
jgi:hypothetical protein